MSILADLQSRRADLQKTQNVRFFWFFEDSPPAAVVDAHMHDPFHDVQVLLRVDLKSMTIADYEILERRAPFASCQTAKTFFEKLRGAPAQPRKLRELLGPGKTACLRIHEVILYGLENLGTALAYHLKYTELPDEWNDEKMHVGARPHAERQELVRHWWMTDSGVADTCHSFNRDYADAQQLEAARSVASSFSGLMRAFRKRVKGRS